MLTFKKEGLVLSKTFAAFESDGVLNPAVIQEGAEIHMFYRAVGTGNYSTRLLHRTDHNPQTVVDIAH